jgi:hypothetical protein
VSGASVSVSSSGTGNQIDPASATSDDNGVATFTFSSTFAENKTITALAGGVTLDQQPTITVNKAESRTHITGHDPNPSDVGQPVHVIVSVVSGQGGGTPTGQVTIVSNRTEESASCIATLDASGQGSCDITLTVAGDLRLIALYPGDSRFDVSNDDVSHHVNPATTNQPPVAAFAAPTNCTVGTPCQFMDSSTDDVGIQTWSWDFGDLSAPSLDQNPTHAFPLGGVTYHVTLTVTDAGGLSNSVTHDVTVP